MSISKIQVNSAEEFRDCMLAMAGYLQRQGLWQAHFDIYDTPLRADWSVKFHEFNRKTRVVEGKRVTKPVKFDKK